MTIEIDFDVFKALTNLRKSERESYNDVLRALLKLGALSEKNEQPNTHHLNQPNGAWIVKNVTFPSGTEFRAKHKGRVITGKVSGGALLVNGKNYNSPSAAGCDVTGTSVNGWIFWECRLPGSSVWTILSSLRK